jgi:hypothetical protein
MPDWTVSPTIEPYETAPGKVDPPPPDQVQPTDPGWAGWARKETDKTGLKWTPECSISLEVRATGRTEDRPLDGDNPTGYTADGNWGWTEDREYETTPPEPYQDFTRWVRHYPKIRWQRVAQYRAQVIVRCGPHFVAPAPYFFYVPVGQPSQGSADEYMWTKTSGLEKGADGKEYKWRTSGKKTPPSYQRANPNTGDLSRPQTTPPEWLVHPIDYHFDPKWDFRPRLKYDLDPWSPKYDPYGPKFDPWGGGYKWLKFGDLPKEFHEEKKDK